MLGELQRNGRSSCMHVNNIHIKDLSSCLNVGQNGHAQSHVGNGIYANGPLAQTFPGCPQVVMRNPKLFYEAAFIARPKLQDALNFRNSRHRMQQQSTKVILTPAYSPPSSTGTGYTGSGVSTPDSLQKGNLRKQDRSTERKCGSATSEKKKHVQFNLQLEKTGYCNAIDSGESDEDDCDGFDEIERSLMHGFSEYDMTSGRLTTGHPGKKKPNLRLDFGLVVPTGSSVTATSTGQLKGEPIDAELPLDQQTWYFGAITRQEAEEILRNCTEGSYIVRACELATRRDYSLAIKSSCGFMHLRIHRQPDDLHRLADFNRVFFTVPDLIEYYSCEKLPIRGAECTILLHPVHQQLL